MLVDFSGFGNCDKRDKFLYEMMMVVVVYGLLPEVTHIFFVRTAIHPKQTFSETIDLRNIPARVLH